MSPLHRQALSLIRAGLSVIPLRARDKTPAIKWEEFQERRAVEDEINQWFVRWPDANLAIVTGKISNLVVVDADGADGLKSLASMGLHSSISALTANGKHLYYRYPEGEQWIKNAVRKFPGIDIRADHGYVVCPPSIHSSGRRYQWISNALVDIRFLPLFPLAMFADATTKASGSSLKASVPESIGELLGRLSEGNRNDTFCRVIGRLHRDGWGSIDIVNLLGPIADQVRFSRSELSSIAASVGRYPRDQTVDNTSHSDTLETFLQESKPVEWIVPGIIARNSLGFVAGLPETGKTWLLIDLAIELSVAHARDDDGTRRWLGKFSINPATVLFIDQERSKSETQRRFTSVLNAKGLKPSDCGGRLHIQCGTSTRLNDDNSFNALRGRMRDIHPDIMIVDSFATFHTSDESNRGDIQKVLERVKQLRNEFNCTIAFIDHENKGVWNSQAEGLPPSMFGMMGSIAKPAAAEWVLTVRKDGDSRMVYQTKNTMGKTLDAFSIEIVDTDNGGIKVHAIH